MRPKTAYSDADSQQPWARYYHPEVLPPPAAILDCAQSQPLPADALPPWQEVGQLIRSGYLPVENGFCLQPDGSARLAIHTPMPGVSPAMWAWWFGWHGSRNDRYKLWHPQAHVSARWADGGDRVAYLGRTSIIEEYIGEKLEKAAIRFVVPESLGLPPNDPSRAVHICARIGKTLAPVDFGWLVHQVRATPEGAEMRSRFWIGGAHIALRQAAWFSVPAAAVLRRLLPVQRQQAADLLLHCAEEMRHLATVLPDLYTHFSTER
jgi:hypothetical protein